MSKSHRVLVSDALAEEGLLPLRSAGNIDVDIRIGLKPDELLQIIGEYDALLIRSATTVTEELIAPAKKLRVIGRAGVGVDNVDIAAATQAGIIVVNAPTGNVVAAAEHTIGMLMTMARRIPQANNHIRSGHWKRNQFVGTEVRNKVLGTIGLGRIAQEVTQRAIGLGMKVIAADPYVTQEYANLRGVKLVDLDTLIGQSDFITVHVPLTDETRNMIGAAELQRMKPGVRLLNIARGGLIDEHALVAAVSSGHVAGAALDVFVDEPLPEQSPLRQSDEIVLTPHLGGSTVEAQRKVAEDVSLQVVDILNNRPARYAVNAPIIPPKDLDFLIPYIDLAERMARFIKQLGVQGMADVEVTAHGPLADHDLSYISAAVIKGLLADVVDVRINLVNAIVMAERRGMNLTERKEHQEDSLYENMLTLSATSDRMRWQVRGSVVHGEPNIVSINDLWIDFPATGNIILTSHKDRPGIIGRVGTMLGKADINISFMHVGRRGPRTEAIMALGTDELAKADVLARIDALDKINWLKSITL